MSNKLSYYQERLNSDAIKDEFIFYLKEKLLFSDKEIYLDKDRKLNKKQQNLIYEFIQKKKDGIPLDYILNLTKFN